VKKIYPMFVIERIWHNAVSQLWMPIPVVAGDSKVMRESHIWFSTN